MQRSIFVLCLRRVPFFRQALFHKEQWPSETKTKTTPRSQEKPTKKQAGEDHPPVYHKLAQLNSLAMEIS